jgi:hypothetical protein
VAEIERSIKMKRTMIAVLSTVALALAAPSFATQTIQLMDQSSPLPMAAIGGAPPVALPPVVGNAAKAIAVTGVVVMSSPEEIILRTASGTRTFEIMPDTQMLAGAATGDVVTVLCQPVHGSVKASVVRSAAKASDSHVKVAPEAPATSGLAPGVSSK